MHGHQGRRRPRSHAGASTRSAIRQIGQRPIEARDIRAARVARWKAALQILFGCAVGAGTALFATWLT